MKRTLLFLGIIAAALLGLLFGTNPSDMPSAVLILPFVLFFAGSGFAVAFVLQHRGFSRLRSLRVGGVAAGLPTALLVLQSIGQLTLRDTATILALFAIAYFYIVRASRAVD